MKSARKVFIHEAGGLSNTRCLQATAKLSVGIRIVFTKVHYTPMFNIRVLFLARVLFFG